MVQEILDKSIRDYHSGKSEEAQNIVRERFTEKYWEGHAEGHAEGLEAGVGDGAAQAVFVNKMIGKLVAHHLQSKPNKTVVACLKKIGITEEEALELQSALLTNAFLDGSRLAFYITYMNDGVNNQDELLAKIINPK